MPSLPSWCRIGEFPSSSERNAAVRALDGTSCEGSVVYLKNLVGGWWW